MKKPPDLKQITCSWSEFCSWPGLYDTHSIMSLWDQPLVFAHFPEDILSYSEESVSYLGTVSSLLGLSFFGQPWELLLSANQRLFLHFCLFSYSCPFRAPSASFCFWCAMLMSPRAGYVWMLGLWLHLDMEIAPECVAHSGLTFLVAGESPASASQVLWWYASAITLVRKYVWSNTITVLATSNSGDINILSFQSSWPMSKSGGSPWRHCHSVDVVMLRKTKTNKQANKQTNKFLKKT